MRVLDTELEHVKIIEPRVFGDKRGFFFESWNQRSFEEHGLPGSFVQDNHSRSEHGVLRGLHYQIKQPQGKLIRVTQGEVFDVAVDMRRSSHQFGQWFGVKISESNQRQLWIPPGYAHGFLVLSPSADFVYKCTDYYAPEYERTLLWNDSTLDIQWPLGESETPRLADKDVLGQPFSDCDCFE
jgi:dTDP-4-dehydrorhamnose 3,5-epimerase